MAKKDKRFIEVYSEDGMTISKVLVDRQIGVNYLFHASGYAGGLTPLLKPDGTPVVTPVSRYEE
ncbi:MAG: DUF6440 family protein [Clostridiales bacterium]|nr:DUF6440 family protein [Clostridiales bacterium]